MTNNHDKEEDWQLIHDAILIGKIEYHRYLASVGDKQLAKTYICEPETPKSGSKILGLKRIDHNHKLI